MDFGNWGRDSHGFHARYGTEPLRGLVLGERVQTDAFEKALGTDLAGPHSTESVRTARGS
jgi:hypothetical protein